MSFTVGENIGPYRIIEQLGQGGMATVYKAYHASLDRYVALKVLHPAFNEDKNFASRFQREARVVAKLEHPHIVPVYDYAEHENRPYLVMKFIEGNTLKARLDQGPLSSDEIADMVDAVGSALAYAHKQGILHRDIKPSNVLLSNDGQIYLADFGLARIAQSGESTMSSDSIMGTPQYISPEQAMGKKDLDARTDLYSFGVMLYEMVVGQVPFSADTPFAIIHDHIYTPLPMPRSVNPNVPQQVERVLLKSLAKERDDRYEDVSRLVQAFKDAWEEAGIPMQGTFVRLSQALKPAIAKTPPSEAPTKLATPAQVSATIAEPQAGSTSGTIKVVATEAAASPAKKRSPWLWVSAGLVIVLCLGFLGFARNNRLFARLLGDANQTPIAATQSQPPTQIPQQTPLPPPQQQPLTTKVGGVLVPPEIAEAQKRANENPNDLNAQLDLALTYWHFNWQKETYETIGNIVRLAGMDNRDFFMQAGDKFKSQNDGWLPAASMYFQAVRAYSMSSTGVPNPVQETFREAMYRSADRPEVTLVVPFERVAEVDEPISLITQARNAYFTGRKDRALDLLNQVFQLEDTSREAALLSGEFALLEGKPGDARKILNQLVVDTGSTPEWIRRFAQQLLDKIK